MKQLIILYLSLAYSIYGSAADIDRFGYLAIPHSHLLTPQIPGKPCLSMPNIPPGFRSPVQPNDNCPNSSYLYIWTLPNAQTDKLDGIEVDEDLKQAYLKITVQAQPLKKKANKATLELLSDALSIEMELIEIIEGEKLPQKKLKIPLPYALLEHLCIAKQ